MLQYASAFDDEVVEPSQLPDGVLESVLEEDSEAVMEAELQPEDTPVSQQDAGRPSISLVHGPYYYFYQGE